MNVFDVIRGDGPIVLGQPHGGTLVSEEIFDRLNSKGQGLDDTDWHITRLYDGLLDGVTVVKSNVHRYVIDANRDPAGVSLYPGQNTTTLCPTTDFDGDEIWSEGQAPSTDEIDPRRLAYHAPYHAALMEELDRVRARHGLAILYDCHSIRSDLPYLFEGTLPINNVGTNNGETCAALVESAVHKPCLTLHPNQTVLNGRFKGGWTTRHYGQPQQSVHAIQMETSQRAYMEEKAPWGYREDRANAQRDLFKIILSSLDSLARSGELT